MTREAPDRSEKVWFKIGEASQLVGATPKELRYWEKVIPELCPRRSKGNLRYYHQEELLRLQRIRQWLSEGFTVSDCRELLRGVEPAALKPSSSPLTEAAGTGLKRLDASVLQTVLEALRSLQQRLGREAGAPTEALLPPLPAPSRRPKRIRPAPAESLAPREPEPEGLGFPVEAPPPEAHEKPESQEALPTPQTPKRGRKPKPEVPVLGRMWSEARLPLDLDE